MLGIEKFFFPFNRGYDVDAIENCFYLRNICFKLQDTVVSIALMKLFAMMSFRYQMENSYKCSSLTDCVHY